MIPNNNYRLSRWLSDKEAACQIVDLGLIDPWVGKIPWGRKREVTPVFLPGKSHGQRSLVDYRPWGHKSQTKKKKQSDRTSRLKNNK